MGRKRGAVLKKDEIKEVVTIAVDELLQSEIAKLGNVDTKAKESIVKNLTRYYKAQGKSSEGVGHE